MDYLPWLLGISLFFALAERVQVGLEQGPAALFLKNSEIHAHASPPKMVCCGYTARVGGPPRD